MLNLETERWVNKPFILENIGWNWKVLPNPHAWLKYAVDNCFPNWWSLKWSTCTDSPLNRILSWISRIWVIWFMCISLLTGVLMQDVCVHACPWTVRSRPAHEWHTCSQPSSTQSKLADSPDREFTPTACGMHDVLLPPPGWPDGWQVGHDLISHSRTTQTSDW